MTNNDEIIECICCYEDRMLSVEAFTKCEAEPKHLICNRCYTDWGSGKCFYCHPFKDISDNNVDHLLNNITLEELLENRRLQRSLFSGNNYRLARTNENNNDIEIERNVQIIIREPNENSNRIRSRNRREYHHHQQNDKNDCLTNPLTAGFIVFVIVYFYIYFYENPEIKQNNDSYNETNTSLM